MTGSPTGGPAGGAAATSSVNLNELESDQLTEYLAGWFERTATQEQRRLLGHVLGELAGGQPVEPARLAALAGLPVSRVEALLRRMSGEWDRSGQRLVGLGPDHGGDPAPLPGARPRPVGLVRGRHPGVSGVGRRARAGRVAVRCHRGAGSGRGDPHGGAAGRAGGRGRVVCHPPTDISQVREAVCFNSHYFRSAAAAASWQARHPDGLVLPVAEAFQVLRRAWGDLPPRTG